MNGEQKIPIEQAKQLILAQLYKQRDQGEEPNSSVQVLAKMFGTRPQFISDACTALSDAGFISFQPIPQDARTTPLQGFVRLLPRGIAKVEGDLGLAEMAAPSTLSTPKSPDEPHSAMPPIPADVSPDLPRVFVIMAVGKRDTDHIYLAVYEPIIRKHGFAPFRLDLHHTDGPLNSEMLTEIEAASIVVADLTYERPNCYAEVGYVLGLRKGKNLILCARSDHDPRRPNRLEGDFKLHFDLDSYFVHYWNASDLGMFSAGFEEEFERRVKLIAQVPTNDHAPDSAVPQFPGPWVRMVRDRFRGDQ